MHPVHDIEVPDDIHAFVPSVIEISSGSHMKYEVDKPTGLLRLDRVLYSAVHYPANYGFIPRTHGDDGDPLDILVITQEPVHPMTIVRARPIGGLNMHDDKGGDDKIIAVCIDDPAVSHYMTVSELPPHQMRELERFFRDYKALENKPTDVGELYSARHAFDVIANARKSYDRGDWKRAE